MFILEEKEVLLWKRKGVIMEKKEYIKMLIPAFAISIIIVILIVVMRNTEGAISVKTVLKYTPENICLAMAVLFCFLL